MFNNFILNKVNIFTQLNTEVLKLLDYDLHECYEIFPDNSLKYWPVRRTFVVHFNLLLQIMNCEKIFTIFHLLL